MVASWGVLAKTDSLGQDCWCGKGESKEKFEVGSPKLKRRETVLPLHFLLIKKKHSLISALVVESRTDWWEINQKPLE